MAFILNIDTATDIASVCISDNGSSIAYRENNQQKEHASFLHTAIDAILRDIDKDLNEMDAFAVTSGPGSYTGLRVGMATAKGFCFAMRKPLITINTLKVMVQAAITDTSILGEDDLLYCPMIDARRMEVYTALYNYKAEVVLQPTAMLLNQDSFDRWLIKHPILFFGSGSKKLTTILSGDNAHFADITHTSTHLAILAHQQFDLKQFADVAYAEPEYLKEFYSTAKT